MRSSVASSPCRFELRPSSWLAAALLALSLLAPVSLLASDMPRLAAWPLAVAALACGLFAFRRERRRPSLTVVIEAPDRISIDGEVVDGFTAEWRGPLAFLRWRDRQGRTHARSLWPDTLSPRLRRELRLALPHPDAGRRRDTMAP
jgi:toxin CptA